MTASRPPFSYHPLDEDTHEIRLIELIPKVDDKNPKSSVDEIQCELVHVKHRSTPADQDVSPPGLDDSRHGWGTFAALSYVWGSIELPKRHIALSGSKFEVTLNLHNALTRLVRLVREDESFPRRVWIDAICIDQGNVDERNKQVPRMRYIYGAASVVVCSLPPEWNVTSKADARAKTMGWDAGAKMVPLLSAAQSDVGAKTLAEHLSTGLVQYSSHGWASLFKFFANPYWTRLWIIQEIALASREILVLAGHNRIPWEKVANAAALFRGLPYATRESVSKLVRASGKSVTPFSSNIDNIVELQRLRTQRIQHEPHPHPSTAIRLARKAQATNERDKVYGILSLVDPSLSEQIHVDYRKTTATIWTEFAAAIVATTNNLQILPLSAQPDHNRARGAPSWVPDLGNGNAAIPLWIGVLVCIPLSEATRPWVDGTVLNVSGRCLDSIISVGAVRSDFDDLFLNTDTKRGIEQSAVASGEKTLRHQRSIEDVYEELVSTLQPRSTGSSPGRLPPLEWLRSKQNPSRSSNRVFEFLERNGVLLLPGGHLLRDVLEQSDRGCHEALGDDDQYSQVVYDIDYILKYRKLAVTARGHIALVPCDTRPDDCIYALYGYSNLGVLRKQGEGWRWVGSCYVHGLTDSDAVLGREEEVERISIR